jgi:UPF0148 protein
MEVRKIVEALEKGATLLGEHCENCGAPLLKKDNEVFCVYCERKEEKKDEKEEITLEEILNETAQHLMGVLRREKDPEKIYKILLSLEKLLDMMERLRKS